ncbi:MAG: N-acetylmuramoyl-L-alanine amidase [Terrimicrobiaceae bacterium]
MFLALGFIPQTSLAIEWEVRRFDGRDYVTTRQISEFYKIPSKQPLAKDQSAFVRGQGSLVFRRDSREAVIHGLKYWLAFPVIERDGAFWVSRMDLAKTIEPAMRPGLVRNLKKPLTVVLDAGHGGQDKGAIGPYQYEKNFALDVARRVRDELKAAGVNVFMTRNSDTFIELPERAAMANKQDDAIFVSIHFNAAVNRAAQGFEVFCITPRGAPSTEYETLLVRDMVQEHGNEAEVQSFVLATAIYHAMHGRSQMMDRGVKRSRFAVLRLTKIPAVLVEGGFLSNPVDARRIASPEWRTRYSKSIAEGILAYIRLADERIPPPFAADYRLPGSQNLRLSSPAIPPPTPPSSVSLRGLPEDEPDPSPVPSPPPEASPTP